MNKVTVYHPANPHINGGFTVFEGPQCEARMQPDGALVVGYWHTQTETGHAYFAAGQWAYVCASKPR